MNLLSSSKQRFGLLTGALLIVIVITLLAIWPLLNPPPPTPLIIETTDSGAHILFSADSDSVPFPGRCVMVRWSVEGIRTVTFNGSGVVGQSEQSACIINNENSF